MNKRINIIIKPVGNKCNLECVYCFAKENTGDSELSVADAKVLIDKLSRDLEIMYINFVWHGGEPLLWKKEYYEEVFEYQRKCLVGKKYMNIFQTNGTLINFKFIALLKKYGAYLGVSIDGPEYEDNINRFKSKEMFLRLLSNLDLLKKHNVQFALFFTLSPQNIIALDKIFDFIKAIKPSAFTLIPMISTDYRVYAEEWGKILLRAAVFQKETGIIHSYNKHLDSVRPSMCFMNGMCKVFITMNNKCDIFKTCRINEALKIGNLYDENIITLINKHIQEPLEFKEGSIYNLMNSSKYKYFQGDGCIYRKMAGSNDDFILGMTYYLRKIEDYN